MKKTCITFILCLAILYLTMLAGQLHINHERRMYNNGVCSCGGHYEFISTIKYETVVRYGTAYIYMCDNCQDILELSNSFQKILDKQNQSMI